MPEFTLLFALLTSIDGKTLNLLRFYELQIDFLRRRAADRLLPDEAEKASLARLAVEIGRPELAKLDLLFHPETLFKWHRDMVAAKFDGSKRRGPGRPSPWRFLTNKVLQLAQENPTWGAPRMHGQLSRLGYHASEPSIRRLMRRLGLNPDPTPSRRWSDFLERNQAAIVATDFFSVETVSPRGLSTQYCLFFIQHDTRKVCLAGITEHPDEAWMQQVARNLTMEDEGFFKGRKYLIMDRDTKFCKSFKEILKSAGVESLVLPKESPDLNAYAERWVRSVKEECIRELPFLPGPASLHKALTQYLEHYHHERAHQGLGNKIPFPYGPQRSEPHPNAKLQRKSRLGGLLNYYYWEGENQKSEAA